MSPSPAAWSRRLAQPATAFVAATLTVVSAGCGAGGDESADPAKVAPARSAVYVVATMRPDGDQKEAVDQIGRKVFRVSDTGKRLQQLVDRWFNQHRATRNVTYTDDVEPWLGRRAAVAITRLGGGGQTKVAIFAAKDTGKAKRFVDKVGDDASPRWPKRSYRGVDYRFDPSDASGQGVVDDYLVAGDEAALKAVIDAFRNGRGLGDDPRYRNVAAGAEGKLAFGYVDVRAATAGLGTARVLPAGVLQSLAGETSPTQPVTFSLSVRPDRVTVDTVARGVSATRPADRTSPLVARLPGDSWLAVGLARVGQSLHGALRQLGRGATEALIGPLRRTLRTRTGLDLDRDVLAAIGDVALFARGSTLRTVGGGLVVATRDPAAARRLVARLRAVVRREAAHGARTADASIAGAHGFRVAAGQLPGTVDVVVKGDRLVAAYGDAATREALSATSPLAGAPDYRAAQESLDGAPPAVFVAFAPVAALVGTRTGTGAQQASAYLSALRTLAVGSRAESDRRTSRLVVTLR